MAKDSFRYKMVIAVRTDLKMSTGKMIAQACHAAVACSEDTKKTHSKQWRNWRDEGAKKVALDAWSMEELEELAKKADELDVVYNMIQDAGHTEIPPGTVTCIGIGPDLVQKIDKVTGSLSLLK
ncbi:MAG: peptidyl-tRNA hydrolase Pth2 [Candidatus Bathyarchaeota archaeon]|nr:peptidyl-tRNA hydrolase Pth2 [Candidatus Bathyarchaeota archaeon]